VSVVTRPHYVYRHYDADRQVLYIGCTHNPEQRFRTQSKAEWWPLVADTEVIGPMPYAEALHAETWAIRADRPPHNKHVPRPRTLAGIKLSLAIIHPELRKQA
jgi:predicted GIY-YIG superfamily endonuclease